MLGLPDDITALLFDLDGVLTQTAKVHFTAWKETFDAFLKQRDGDGFTPFTQDDYNEYVDGMPRFDGVRSFLKSRSVELPEGSAADAGDARTVQGLGNQKNDLVLELIKQDGVEVYDGSVAYVKAAKAAGLKCAVVSASANCKPVLKSAGIIDLFDAIVDGAIADERELQGKPHPDTYLAGAQELGVEAGHDGHFGYVVGVDRVNHAQALSDHGADVVVSDLSELLRQNTA